MNENTNDFLGISAEAKDAAPATNNNGGNTGSENIIIIIAYAILIIGILSSLINGISLLDSRYTRSMGVAVLIVGPIFSAISWAILMIMARLSINVREIKEILSLKSKGNE